MVTAGANEVQSYSKTDSFSVAVTKVPVLDTTAAGDAFVGTWLYQIAQQLELGESLTELVAQPELQWQMINKAIRAGSLTCQQYGAFSSLPDSSLVFD